MTVMSLVAILIDPTYNSILELTHFLKASRAPQLPSSLAPTAKVSAISQILLTVNVLLAVWIIEQKGEVGFWDGLVS